MPHTLNAPNHGSDVARAPIRMDLPSAEGASRMGEEPDPAYWSVYDFHMIEREARAMRRARMYSTIATYGVRLSQLIANSARALWTKRRQPSVSVACDRAGAYDSWPTSQMRGAA